MVMVYSYFIVIFAKKIFLTLILVPLRFFYCPNFEKCLAESGYNAEFPQIDSFITQASLPCQFEA